MAEWKQFRDTFYEVSDTGIIRTIYHTVTRSNGKKHQVVSKVLKPALDNKGYLRVGLSIGGKLSTFKVHRMVAECFVPNPDNLPQVNHEDGNKQNNNSQNLTWATNAINVQHAYDNGLITNIHEPVKDKSNFPKGEENHEAKLTWEIVRHARNLKLMGKSYQSIADQYGVCKKTMMHAIKGITWKKV